MDIKLTTGTFRHQRHQFRSEWVYKRYFMIIKYDMLHAWLWLRYIAIHECVEWSLLVCFKPMKIPKCDESTLLKKDFFRKLNFILEIFLIDGNTSENET